jgi:hypothetical protein
VAISYVLVGLPVALLVYYDVVIPGFPVALLWTFGGSFLVVLALAHGPPGEGLPPRYLLQFWIVFGSIVSITASLTLRLLIGLFGYP